MQLTLHATRPTTSRRFALGASNACLVGKNPMCSVPACRDARVNGHTTTAIHGNDYIVTLGGGAGLCGPSMGRLARLTLTSWSPWPIWMHAPLADPRAMPSPLDAVAMHISASPVPCSSVTWKNSRLGVPGETGRRGVGGRGYVCSA